MSYHILIADDSMSMRKVLKKVLQMCNLGVIDVFEANNGAEALKILETEWIDLVFTDINMPEMNGIEFIKEANKNDMFRNIPFIIVTSEVRLQETRYADEVNAQGLVMKPFKPEEIRDIIVEQLHLEMKDENTDTEGIDF